MRLVVYRLALSGLFAAVGIILSFLSFKWPMTGYLRLDFSAIIVVLGFIYVGFFYTIACIVVQEIGYFLLDISNTGGLPGHISNTLSEISLLFFLVIFYWIFFHLASHKHKLRAIKIKSKYNLAINFSFISLILSSLFAVLFSSLVMCATNYAFILKWYGIQMNWNDTFIIFFPFNIVKYLSVVALALIFIKILIASREKATSNQKLNHNNENICNKDIDLHNQNY